MLGLNQSLHQWTNLLTDASIVVTGHLTKSIAQHALRLSGVTNDHNTKTDIPGRIHTNNDLGV